MYLAIGICSLNFFFFSSRRRHTRSKRDWSSDVCSSDLKRASVAPANAVRARDAPPERVENLTRAREIVSNLRQILVSGRIRAHGRSERRKREGIVDAAHERDAVRRHGQRAAQLTIAEDGMWPVAIRGIAQVELREEVLQSVISLR